MSCWTSLFNFFSFYWNPLRTINCKYFLFQFCIFWIRIVKFLSNVWIKFFNVDFRHKHGEDFIWNFFWNNIIKNDCCGDLSCHVFEKIAMSHLLYFINNWVFHSILSNIFFVNVNFESWRKSFFLVSDVKQSPCSWIKSTKLICII